MSGANLTSPIKHCSQKTTDATGIWTGTVIPGLMYWVQPMTTGDFVNSITLVGSTMTVSFSKFRRLGLVVTVAVTTSIFEDVTGAVSFNLIGSEAC